MDEFLSTEIGFMALSNVTRLAIVEALASGPKTHVEIAVIVDKPLSAWYQLKVLYDAGLVCKNRIDSKTVLYALVPQRFQELSDYLRRFAEAGSLLEVTS